MPNQLPVTIDFGTLPNNGQGYTPQELANRLGTNGRIFTEQDFALFVTGSTAPTSDVGPWAANGNTWYYFDTDTGSYVPFLIPQESLKFFVGSTTPDEDVYQFWIQLSGGGSPLALKTWFSGAWVDVYATTLSGYSTTVAMNAAIAAAAATTLAAAEAYTDSAVASVDAYAARGDTSGAQVISVTGAPFQVNFTDENFDPSNVYDAPNSRYVCPVNGIYQVSAELQVDNDTGTAASMELSIDVAGSLGSGTAVGSPPGSRWYPSVSGLIQKNAGDFITVELTANDGVNSGAVEVSNGSFSVHLVQAT